MNIRILGAHHSESGNKKCVCFKIDDVLAVEAGALTSSLSDEELKHLKGVLITHAHFDHIRDIPILGLNLFTSGASTKIYSTKKAQEVIHSHLLNDIVYPDFFNMPAKNPALGYVEIKPFEAVSIENYNILAIPVNHPGGAVGYQISDENGDTVFYTGDTGPGLSAIWPQIAPQGMIIEVSLPNRCLELALSTGHLTPELLRLEMMEFLALKGYIPHLYAIHIEPGLESEIEGELAQVSRFLDVPIVMCYEGLRFDCGKYSADYVIEPLLVR